MLYHQLKNDAALQDANLLLLQTSFKMGRRSHNLGRFEDAIRYYTEAKKISKFLQDNEGIVNAFFLTGHVYDSMGEKEEAVKSWEAG